MTNSNGCSLTEEIWAKLSKALKEPFPESEINVRVGVTFKGGSSGIALPYIDARQVMDRLDDVVGAQNWSDSYKVVDNQSVVCELTINGITKSDAGQSTPDGSSGRGENKALKAAVSDAFKRAAVKWGIGQFLYSLPTQFENLKDKKFIRNQRAIVRDILRKSGLILEVPGKSPQPAPQATPKTTPPAKAQPDSKELTSQQKASMQELKTRLRMHTNPMLDPFIVDWSKKKLSSYKDLNGDNVDEFIKFLNEKHPVVVDA